MHTLLDELTWRGLVQDQTPGLKARLAKESITGYVGFDPTAPSLQVGNLVVIMLLAHLQRAGGRPIVLSGGGTGLIGDPSGKREERPLLDQRQVDEHVARQRAQLERFLDFSPGPRGAELLNNADWLRPLNLVAFLRDIGKHFTLSFMLQKESVKARLEGGISYTEFSYMLLQAYDFLHLYQTKRCELQMGGSDQWGNITAGIELIRRVEGAEAHGLSAPLLTTAAGAKFGKTEAGSVWLDPALTSPYKFYQFWINADDRDVEGYLRAFTFKSRDELKEAMAAHKKDSSARIPHTALARDVTTQVHGPEAAKRAEEASQIIFGRMKPEEVRVVPRDTWKFLSSEIPSSPLPTDCGPDSPVLDIVQSTGISRSEARRLITQGGLYWNGMPLSSTDAPAGQPLGEGFYWLRIGKKNNYLFTIHLPEEY